MSAKKLIEIESTIKLSFEDITLQLQRFIDDRKNELESIIKDAVDNFNFEEQLKYHVDSIIYDHLEKAFGKIDLTQRLKDIAYKMIDERLSQLEK